MIDWLLAADIYLTLGGWSEHGKKEYEHNGVHQEYNGSHEAVILDYKGLTVGTFKNSYHSRTNLIGYTYHWNNFAITSAYGTGYREVLGACRVDLGKECLLITASYSFEPFKLSLMGDALALSFEFKLM
ncbi:MAG: hypothetical protein GY781_13730 [Gammaproteobacteria bacterium]|nr:hypothetical protein [Gammaproteobacteria bacterium]